MGIRLIPLTLELLGIATIGSGIGIELAYQADTGYIMISIGSLMVATGGVIWGKFVKGRK